MSNNTKKEIAALVKKRKPLEKKHEVLEKKIFKLEDEMQDKINVIEAAYGKKIVPLSEELDKLEREIGEINDEIYSLNNSDQQYRQYLMLKARFEPNKK